MNLLEKALISPLVLALPGNRRQITLDTDASNVQTGCALLQQQPGETAEPGRYWSRLLTDAGRKYDTKQRERLAVLPSILLLRPYL